MRRSAKTRWFLGLFAVALLATGGKGIGCGGYDPDRQSHEMTVRVHDARGEAIVGFEVSAWIIDTDEPGAQRQPVALEPQLTNDQGEASWIYEAFLQPYICGFEVRDVAGDVVADQPPFVTQQMTGANGTLELAL